MVKDTSISSELSARARSLMPGGVSHYFRYHQPYPLYIAKAEGAYKWDENSNRYIDYKMGSASQLLGHCPPKVVEAVRKQMEMTPFTADCHRLEVEWAEIISRLFPSIERVRFTASGTESTMLAIRLGRAFSGRSKVLRVSSHYHGWHDSVMKGAKPTTNTGANNIPTLGVPDEISDLIIVVEADIEAVRAALSDQQIGTIIVEASGANYGAVPLPDGFLSQLRHLVDQDRVLIFDEVITGFRWAPGGRQQLEALKPDLTTLAKVLTGGLPGGAVGGREDIMRLLDPEQTIAGISPPVLHQGTFNANNLVAAGAIAALNDLSTGSPQRQADKMAAMLRAGMNTIFTKHGINGCCYGESSTFHLYFGACNNQSVKGISAARIRGARSDLIRQLKTELNARGVDMMSSMSGVTSAAHTEDDIAQSLDIFDETFDSLKKKGLTPDD